MRYVSWILILLSLLSCHQGGDKNKEASQGLGSLVKRSYRFTSNWKFNLGDKSGAEAPDFNDDDWKSIDVPHDWSIHLAFNKDSPAESAGGYLDGGVAWYRKAFSVPRVHKNKRIIIRFDGVYMNSEVWINGTYLGHRPYGYIWFEYDLTDHLHFGGKKNIIAVRVNNKQPSSRWYSGSGIYRNVWLTMLNPVHIPYAGYYVSTPLLEKRRGVVKVQSEVRNTAAAATNVTLKTDIVGPHRKIVATHTSQATSVAAGTTRIITQSLNVNKPQRWTLDDPLLYTAITKVFQDGSVVDSTKSTFGFRTFRFDANTGFYLNNVNMKLNGVCLHHDLGALGAAVNYRAIERQLQIMKAMGANAIRTSHNPADPALLEICDRIGLIVQEEAFDTWRFKKMEFDYNLYFDDWGEADIRAMVRRDRNHPSILMWSIGNEIADTVPDTNLDGITSTKNLIAWVKEEDNTRVVTMGSNHVGYTEEASGMVDAIGINYNPHWYDEQHEKFPEWKIYASETSSAVRSRGVYYTPTDELVMPTKENNYLDHQLSSYDNSVVDWGSSAEASWRAVNTRDFIAGEFIWTGFDYIGEPAPYGWPIKEAGWPSKNAYFGIVDTAGFPKDIYYFYQSKWGDKPMVHLLPHWNWKEGDTIEVWAYTNAEKVELFLNDLSLGMLTYPTDPQEPQHLTWKVPFKPGTLRAKAYNGCKMVAMDEMTTAGDPSKVQLLADRRMIQANGRDLVFVETNILDAKNVFVPTASNKVQFEVNGPGKIVGVDNGNSASVEPYKGSSRLAFNGKCLVIVQSTGKAGRIKVKATSDALTSAEVTVYAK